MGENKNNKNNLKKLKIQQKAIENNNNNKNYLKRGMGIRKTDKKQPK